MLPNKSHYALATQLSASSTLSEQAAIIALAIQESIDAASIGTAQALANLIKTTPIPDDMPLVSWPGAQRFAATICERYAQHLQFTTDNIPKESAYSAHKIGPVEVHRDARGFWRHPLYPLFSPLHPMARTVWFAVNGLDGCGTYLTPPEGESTSPNSVAAWNYHRPNGDKWFLLAIEPTDSGPVALWADPVGQA